MRSLLNKAGAGFKDLRHDHYQAPNPHHQKALAASKPTAQDPNQYTVPPPATALDVLRYRYHHGANLGSIYVLEKWLFGSMFPSTTSSSQTSELEAVSAWVAAGSANSARARFEHHWISALSDADIQWLATTGRCTTIRLPIGYFTLGPHFCTGTPFAPYSSVYTNAWPSVKQLLSRLAAVGIGVLIDLHALPGGANNQDHSGTNSGVAGLWASKTNLDLATKCVCFMAQEMRNNTDSMVNVIGIQLCNEAEFNAPGMYDWYDATVAAVSNIDATVPLYISDGWDFPRCISYVQNVNKTTSALNPVVIDTHLYWAFSDAKKKMTPAQIVADVSNTLTALDNHDANVMDRGAVSVVVGEYSCVMDGASWSKLAPGASRDDVVRQFGNAQSQRYQSRGGGCAFWTDKMDWMPGGEWGFVAMSEASPKAVTAPPNLLLGKADVQARLDSAMRGQDDARKKSVDAHAQYWDRQSPGQEFEHWRFEAGWKVGFSDAVRFFGARAKGWLGSGGGDGGGGDKVGLVDLWVLKRIRESDMVGGFVWEFEQGVRKGMDDFGLLAGV